MAWPEAPAGPEASTAQPSGRIDCLAELCNEELRSLSPDKQQDIRRRLAQWFQSAPALIAARRLDQAATHAHELMLEIEAVRLNHTPDANRASQALDKLICSARSAVEVCDEPPDSGTWHEPAMAMQRNFEMQERAWAQGRLAGADFMKGHEVLIQETLVGLSRALGLEPTAALRPNLIRREPSGPADSATERPTLAKAHPT